MQRWRQDQRSLGFFSDQLLESDVKRNKTEKNWKLKRKRENVFESFRASVGESESDFSFELD